MVRNGAASFHEDVCTCTKSKVRDSLFYRGAALSAALLSNKYICTIASSLNCKEDIGCGNVNFSVPIVLLLVSTRIDLSQSQEQRIVIFYVAELSLLNIMRFPAYREI